MKRIRKIGFLAAVICAMFAISAYAATFSDAWYQGADGNWHVSDGMGGMVKNAWLCDDAVAENGLNVWYLIDANGNMISAGLVQDNTGNYYSLETNHNGYYGMLRYISGTYDGINLSLDSNHGGSFAAIMNSDGIQKLHEKFGVKRVNIDNSNIIYTSSINIGNTGSDTTVRSQAQKISLTNCTVIADRRSSIDDTEMTSLGKSIGKNIRLYTGGASSPGYIEYYAEPYNTLEFTFAPRKGYREDCIGLLEVYGDDAENDLLFQSDEITYKSKPETLTLDISPWDYIRIKFVTPERYGDVLVYDAYIQ